MLAQGIEVFSVRGGGNYHRAAEFLGAGCQVDRMKPMEIAAALLGLGIHVKGSACLVNGRSSSDADLRCHVAATADIAVGHRRAKIVVPERADRAIVRVEGVEAVAVRADVHHVARLSAHGDARNIEGLRIYLSVHGVAEQFAEPAHVHVRRCQADFLQIRAGAGEIVVMHQDVHRACRQG
jgi:hypothetical protein